MKFSVMERILLVLPQLYTFWQELGSLTEKMKSHHLISVMVARQIKQMAFLNVIFGDRI